MDYDKNTIIAFILIFVVLIAYWWLNAPQRDRQQIVETEVLSTDSLHTDSTLFKIKKDTTQVTAVKEVKSDSVSKISFDKTENFPFLGQAIESGKDIIIDNSVYRSIINSKGAVIKSWRLKKYAKPNSEKVNGVIQEEDWVELIAPNEYFDSFFKTSYLQDYEQYDFGNLGLFFPTKQGAQDTSPLEFMIEDSRTQIALSENNLTDSLVYSLKLANGGSIKKKYKFYYGKYDFDLTVELNQMDELLNNSYYRIEWKSGLSPTESDVSDDLNYAKGYVRTGKEIIKEDVHDDDEEAKQVTGKIDWIGTTTKYFAVSIIPEFTNQKDYQLIDANIDGQKVVINPDLDYSWKKFKLGLKVPTYSAAHISHDYKVFLGPLDYFELKKYDNKMEGMIDLGYKFLRPIGVAILYAFVKLHSFIPNYGLVIIIFSILIKIILYPLTKKSYASMKKMQELQPALNELKEKHKDPRKLQQAQMRLYKERGVNPVGGCLPMLLQMPLLFALYWVFRNTIELRGEPFIWWISDLSMPDTLFTLPFSIPMYGNKFNVLPLLMGVSMIFQQQMTMKDPKQKAMVYIMPVFMILIFNRLSSGLNLYYTLFNVFSMVQQVFSKTNDKKDNVIEEKAPVTQPVAKRESISRTKRISRRKKRQ